MNFATYGLFIAFPILLSYTIAAFSGQRIASFLPLSYLIAVFWAFGFGMFDQLDFGVKILFPALLILTSLMLIFKKNFVTKERILQLTSPAMVFFLVFSAWTFVHSRNMRFYQWDEFSGWGPFVKSIFLFDQLGPYSPADLPFASYVPGVSMLPYLAMKIGGEWNEGLVYWSYQVLIVAILVSIFPIMKWRKYGPNILVIVSSLLTATFFYNSFQTVYADPLLGLLFGLGIILAASKDLSKDKWSFLNFVALVTFISIAKEIGVYFSLTLILIMGARIFITSSIESGQALSKIVTFVRLAIFALIPIVAIQMAWKALLSGQQVPGGRSSFGAVQGIFGRDGGGVRAFWSDEVFSTFSTRTIVDPLTAINWFPMTTMTWFVVFTLALALLALTRNQRRELWRNALISSILMFGFLGYLVTLLFLYMTVFTAEEAASLASYERYVATYLAGIALFLNYHFLNDLYRSSNSFTPSVYSAAWITILLLLSSSINLMSYVSSPNHAATAKMSPFDDERKLIKNMNLQVDDDVWIIAQHTTGFEFYFFNYEMLPASVGRSPFSIGSNFGEGDIWTDVSYTKEKWASKLNDFEYVFVHNASESFINEFGDLFEDPRSVITPGFYRVIRDLNGITLTRIN